jgi:hypothetical protein
VKTADKSINRLVENTKLLAIPCVLIIHASPQFSRANEYRLSPVLLTKPMPPLRLAQVVISAQLVLEGMPFFSRLARYRAPLTSRNHRATEAVDESRFVDGGSSHERRPLYPLGAPASGNRDGGIGRADPRPDRQPQAASNAALVLLRRRLYTGGLAPDRPADGPRANFTAANRVAGGPAKATSSRCARSARGKQRSIVSNLDSGPQTQIARGGRSSTRRSSLASRSSSFANLSIKATRWHFDTEAFTSVT